MPFRSILRIILFLMLICFITSCGGDDFTDNVSRIEIAGPVHVVLGAPIQLTVGVRAGLSVTAYNHTGVPLDIISGAEVYQALKWKSSDSSIIEVELSELNSVVIRCKKQGEAVITASLDGISSRVPLTVR